MIGIVLERRHVPLRGQANLFEFTAGLNPLDPDARRTLSIALEPGQPSQENLISNPVVAGRTDNITVKSTLSDQTW